MGVAGRLGTAMCCVVAAMLYVGAGRAVWAEQDGGEAGYFGARTFDSKLPTQVFVRDLLQDRWQKLGIAARWALAPPRRSALP